jgi:hypothetical protein
VWTVNLAAVLGWTVVTALSLYPSDPALIPQRLALVPWAALFGLPIAFIACWVVAAPILARVMRRSISWFSAAGWGAILGALIAAVGLAIDRLFALRAANDPNFGYQIGGGDFVQEIDGVLTSYGWWVKAQGFLYYVLIGVAVALVLRWIIGPGIKKGGTAESP